MTDVDRIIFINQVQQSIEDVSGLLGADFTDIIELTYQVLDKIASDMGGNDDFNDYWVNK